MTRAIKHGTLILWLLAVGIVAALALSALLLKDTAELRYVRDVNRLVFNGHETVLDALRAQFGSESDSMRRVLAPPADSSAPYLVVSIADHRLWYRRGREVLFTAPVATASGKTLVGDASGQQWRFETPRGRLVVQDKDENPAWVPPDWHYIEQAHKRGVGLVRLQRGQTVQGAGGATYTVQGSDVVRKRPDGQIDTIPPPAEGKELIVNGNLLVPPFGTNQRRYLGTLGTRRLDLGDGYGIHGTDEPASVGHSVSHGCVRMLNEDIERLYPMVPIGTPVYIY